MMNKSKFKVGDIVMRVTPPNKYFKTDMKVGDVAVVTGHSWAGVFLDKFPGRGHSPEALVLVADNFENI